MTVDANITQTTASGLTIKLNTDKTFTSGGAFGGVEYNDNLYFGNAIDDYCIVIVTGKQIGRAHV